MFFPDFFIIVSCLENIEKYSQKAKPVTLKYQLLIIPRQKF